MSKLSSWANISEFHRGSGHRLVSTDRGTDELSILSHVENDCIQSIRSAILSVNMIKMTASIPATSTEMFY